MTNRKPWTDPENAALATLYFSMLDEAIAGHSYSKAELIRLYRGENCDSDGPLVNRSRGSIEFKLMNASAAHADLAQRDETMHDHGYRALPNYQASLMVAMRNELFLRSQARWSDMDTMDEPAGAV